MSTFEQVAVAFKNLRKLGYIARKRFACCGGCAGCAIANDVEKMPEAKRARILGAVFYTRQDADVGRSKRLAIAYGPVEVDEVGTFGRPAAEVGVARSRRRQRISWV